MHAHPAYWRKSFSIVILSLIIIFYLINGICYLRAQSITSDEGAFFDYAIRFLKGQPDRAYPVVDNSKMPVNILNTIPRVICELTGTCGASDDGGIRDTMNGRYVTLAVSVLIILLVYRWGRKLYGEFAGLFSAFLMSVCPNNISHAALVTTDTFSVLMLLSSMYFLWRFCRIRTNQSFILFSLAVALSQLVKQSLFHLYLLAPFCMAVYFLVYREKFRWPLFIKRVLVFAAITVLVINLGYYFHESFTPLGDYSFSSNFFQGLQQAFPRGLPIPFPTPFTEGLDMVKYYDQVGGGIKGVSSFGKPTILGESRTTGSFWYYYPVSILYKTPLPYFFFMAWGGFITFKKRTLKTFVSHEFFLLAPVIYYLVYLDFFYKTQIGIRHIIFIYPFLFILCGPVINHLKTLAAKLVFGIMMVLLLLSVFRYWGNYYPYTNELVWDKKNAYMKVGVSNIEFHQGVYFANRYLAKHPEVQWAPKEPRAGTFLISPEHYEDIWNLHEYDWIKAYKPVGHVAYNYLLIEVPSIVKGN